MTTPSTYTRLAAAYVRGWLQHTAESAAQPHLFTSPLDALAPNEMQTLIDLGRAHGLRLHRFKRTMGLPRVQKVLGILRGMQPANLLDIGSGRGAFLWPLLDDFPYLPVTAVDTLAHRVADMQVVREGGITTLTAMQADATTLDVADRSFDVVTMLEVLEHIPAYEQALAEVCRVTRHFLVLSVPSRSDDNPEHIHLFSGPLLRERLQPYVARSTVEYVHNHIIVVCRMKDYLD